MEGGRTQNGGMVWDGASPKPPCILVLSPRQEASATVLFDPSTGQKRSKRGASFQASSRCVCGLVSRSVERVKNRVPGEETGQRALDHGVGVKNASLEIQVVVWLVQEKNPQFEGGGLVSRSAVKRGSGLPSIARLSYSFMQLPVFSSRICPSYVIHGVSSTPFDAGLAVARSARARHRELRGLRESLPVVRRSGKLGRKWKALLTRHS